MQSTEIPLKVDQYLTAIISIPFWFCLSVFAVIWSNAPLYELVYTWCIVYGLFLMLFHCNWKQTILNSFLPIGKLGFVLFTSGMSPVFPFYYPLDIAPVIQYGLLYLQHMR